MIKLRPISFVASLLLFAVSCSLLLTSSGVNALGEVLFAVNCGGDSFVDSYGIRYKKDYLSDGTASDYGRVLDIKRVPPQDKPLYQFERYASETFGYTIAIPSSQDADYVLWLKFSEVWFNAPHQKVFDVSINGVYVVNDLDIFAKVGRGVAHDEIVPFQVKQNKLIVNGKSQPFKNEIRVEFVKGERDNPKINAIVVVKGTPDQIPPLLPYEPEKPVGLDDEDEEFVGKNKKSSSEDDEEVDDSIRERLRKQREAMQQNLDDNDEEESKQRAQRNRKKSTIESTSEPVLDDPYASDESSYIIPILVAIGAFIPLLFCLCKL